MASWRLLMRWKHVLRFRLRSLLVLVALVAALLGWWSDRQRLEERIQQRDDLLSILSSAPSYPRAYDRLPPDTPGYPVRRLLQWHSADQFVRSLRDGSDWAKLPNGKLPSLSFQPEALKQEAAPHLARLLKDADPNIRERAAYALRSTGLPTAEIASALIAALRDDFPAVRLEASRSLREAPSVPGPFLGPALAPHLDGERPAELDGLIGAIRRHDGMYDLNPRLLELVAHENAKTRAIAAANLSMAATNPEIVTRLLAVLDDSDAECRAEAAYALGDAEPSGEVLRQLTQAFKKETDAYVRRSLARSVDAIHRRNSE